MSPVSCNSERGIIGNKPDSTVLITKYFSARLLKPPNKLENMLCCIYNYHHVHFVLSPTAETQNICCSDNIKF